MPVRFHDSTLRDGQHAVRHRLSRDEIASYARAAEASGVDTLEVGHGNGLGASSIHIGRAALTDRELLATARGELRTTKLGAFMAPGWGTKDDISAAADLGADVLRVAAHCTEADVAVPYLRHATDLNLEAQGVLLMSHMAPPDDIAIQAAIMGEAGAAAVGFLDSAGSLLPDDVAARVQAIRERCPELAVIFHGHNNLGVAVWNSVTAAREGATIIDACACGLGAGAGNTSIEQCAAVFDRIGITTTLTARAAVDLGAVAAAGAARQYGLVDPVTVASGMAGVFSGFRSPVLRTAKDLGLSPVDLFLELGRMRVVAGQEDLIDVAAARLLKPRYEPTEGRME